MPKMLFMRIGAIVALCGTSTAQSPFHKVSVPAGKTIEKAIAASWLTHPDATPFHLKMTIAPTKADPALYSGTIEETWRSPNEWKRTVTGPGLSQTLVMNATGLHVLTEGSYYPLWLRSFVNAAFNPMPDIEQWESPKLAMEYLEGPRGPVSTPCAHQEFDLGDPPLTQINFANVCIKDGLLERLQSSNYNASFSDYQPFGKLKIARKISFDLVRVSQGSIVGTVDLLEPAVTVADSFFETPEGAASINPLEIVRVSTATLKRLAGGEVHLPWPDPIPGHGMFTAWVSVDTSGTVREARPLNSDESGFAGSMTEKLVGQQWKKPMAAGNPVQVEGALVFAYPPNPAP